MTLINGSCGVIETGVRIRSAAVSSDQPQQFRLFKTPSMNARCSPYRSLRRLGLSDSP